MMQKKERERLSKVQPMFPATSSKAVLIVLAGLTSSHNLYKISTTGRGNFVN